MDLYCNGIVIYSKDEEAKFSKDSSFEASYGEPWFLVDEEFEGACIFPEKNTPRTLAKMPEIQKYINAAVGRGFDVEAYLCFSKANYPCMEKEIEHKLLKISDLIGYDYLNISMGYSLVYDVLVKSFLWENISFSEEENESEEVLSFIYNYRDYLNSWKIFDDKQKLKAFIQDNEAYVKQSCENLVLPELGITIDLKQGVKIDESLVFQMWKVDMQKLEMIFAE